MDYRDHGQRPPRSSRPPVPPSYPNSPEPRLDLPEVPFPSDRPPVRPSQGSTFSKGGVSFQAQERGDRHEHVGERMQPSAWGGDPEAGEERVGRKKSLVRPDREKMEPGHRLWHYRTHAAQLEQEHGGRVGVMPSSGYIISRLFLLGLKIIYPATGNAPPPGRPGVRRGRSILGREEDVHESGLALFKRGTTRRLRRQPSTPEPPPPQSKGSFLFRDVPGPKDWWMLYCVILTICIPNFLLGGCGTSVYPNCPDDSLYAYQVLKRPNNSEHGGRRWASLVLLLSS
jgi:chitin synthase